jgi:serine/threonine protein kinase
VQARTLNGRYRLDEMIGEGGMAVVYRGYDLILGRVVAVKLLREQFGSDQNFLLRFTREAQSAAKLSHPHIANVYDVGHDADTHYIVMEYVNGPNLKDLIRRQGPFTVDGAAFVLRQVAEALDAAHRHGLVHRDIKPQNILVDESGQAKVVDFGIAKGLSDANLTEAGTGMGTVHYVSPEQARGERATPASDIYSTGVVLYEMLTKELPFDADTPVGVAMQHVSAPPPSPIEFNPSLPPEVEAIVMRALAKNPEDRYPTAMALAAALDHWDEAPESAQATRVMGAGGAAAAAATRPARARASTSPTRTVRSGGRPPSRTYREQTFRDDIGCVTWLIGTAILIGLVGLVVLGFKLGDFSFLDPSGSASTSSPTSQSNVLVPPTSTPTISVTPTQTAKSTPTATKAGTPTVSATPTETATPTPTASPTPETANVPNLINSTMDQAQTAIIPGNFQLKQTKVYNDVVPAGVIVDQSPAPATQAQKGSTINVTVSLGPEFISFPSMNGQSEGDARGLLESKGLTVKVVEQASKTVDEGVVIKTDPAGQVKNGGTVTLYVSVGDKVQVPDVFGVPYQQALPQLENAGLKVDPPNAQSCSYIKQNDPTFDCASFPDGGVVSATQQWNSWVPRGTEILVAYYDASK